MHGDYEDIELDSQVVEKFNKETSIPNEISALRETLNPEAGPSAFRHKVNSVMALHPEVTQEYLISELGITEERFKEEYNRSIRNDRFRVRSRYLRDFVDNSSW